MTLLRMALIFNDGDGDGDTDATSPTVHAAPTLSIDVYNLVTDIDDRDRHYTCTKDKASTKYSFTSISILLVLLVFTIAITFSMGKKEKTTPSNDDIHASSRELQTYRGPPPKLCPLGGSVEGYSTYPDLKDAIQGVWYGGAQKGKGGIIRICPGSRFTPSGQYPWITIDRTDTPVIIQCGNDGNAGDNCVFHGGHHHFKIFGKAGSVTIKGITFQNAASGAINALEATESTIQFEDCVFQNNKSNEAAVINSHYADQISFTRCKFLNNRAPLGCMLIRYTHHLTRNNIVRIEQCLFKGNIAEETQTDYKFGGYSSAVVPIASAAMIDVASLEVKDSCFIENNSDGQATIGLSSESALLSNQGNYFGGNEVASQISTGAKCHGIVWKDSFGYPDRCYTGDSTACALIEGNGDPASPKSHPQVQDDEYTVFSGQFLDIERPGVLQNDDGNLPISVKRYDPEEPFYGELTVFTSGAVTYQAPDLSASNSGQATSVAFTYDACYTDWPSICAQAKVTISIIMPEPVKPSKPDARDDTFTITSGQELSIEAPGILQNDWTQNGEELFVKTITRENPWYGKLTVYTSGKIKYTPVSDWAVPVTFTYKVCYKDWPELCDSGTVVIKVMETPTLQSYYFHVDCDHGGRYTGTVNTVTAGFYYGDTLLASVRKDGMDCRSGEDWFSTEVEADELIDRVSLRTNGSDALIIDRAWLSDASGSVLKRWGADGHGVYCLSSDPEDAKAFNVKVLPKSRCYVALNFP